MNPWHRCLGALALVGALAGMAMCTPDLDTRRVPPEHVGTVPEEVFRVVCERVDVGESPDDLDFTRARGVCTGTTPAAMATGVGPKVRALGVRRGALVSALDRAFPAALYEPTDRLLINLLPLYGPENGRFTPDAVVHLLDGGTAPAEDLLPQSTRAVARLLTGMATNNDAVAALARISRHQGYRPPRVALGLTRNLLGYPRVGEVLDRTLALIRDEGSGRPAGPANAHWHTALDVLRGELATAAPAPPDEQMRGTTLDATLDLLFRTDSSLATDSTRARLLVRRDPRGMPRVVVSSGGALPEPFVDLDMDGLADARDARFVGRDGRPLTVPSPFPANEAPDGPRDPQGRAVVMGTTAPIYQYLDLDQTVLAALLRDSRTLVDPANNTALRLAHGASVLMGPRAPATRDYMVDHRCPTEDNPTARCRVPAVRYAMFDTSREAPLVDAAHAAGMMLTSSSIDPVLQTFEALFSSQEGLLARNTAALLEIDRSADMHPEAVMDPRSNIWDDVMDVARRIAAMPGLLEDILAALADPRSQTIGQPFAAFIRNRDRIEPTWTAASQNASLASRTLSQPVDRTRPDTMDNRSVFQRFLHLVHDLNGVQLCNKENARVQINGSFLRWPISGGYRECELIRIPDAAVFYIKVIAGTARIEMMDSGLLGFISRIPGTGGTMDWLIENQSGITGFDTTPSPQGVNRLVFQPDALRTEFTRNLLDPVRTRDGLDVRTLHGGTLFALETYNTYEAMRPLVQAFVRHGTADDPDAGAKLFVDLISALHLHYATRQAGQYQSTDPRRPLYSTMDGAQRYEPILADVFSGDLMAASGELMRTLPNVNAGGGRNGRDAIAMLVRLLLDPAAVPNIAYRDGRTTTVRSDGITPVPRPNLYYLFADAMNGIDAAFATHPAERDSWENARSMLIDTFLTVDAGGTSSARFRNRAAPVVSRLAIRWLRDRIAAHRAQGDLDAWARSLGSRLGETVRGPAFSATIDLLLDVYADPPARAATGSLLSYLLDDSGTDAETPFGTTLVATADLLQILRADADVDPLLHALAPGFQRTMFAANGTKIPGEAVPVALHFLERSRRYDGEHVLDRILANLVSRPANPLLADEPIVVFGDAIAETHRRAPGSGGPLDAMDWRAVLNEVSAFFTDESRGMEQFYFIVQNRRL